MKIGKRKKETADFLQPRIDWGYQQAKGLTGSSGLQALTIPLCTLLVRAFILATSLEEEVPTGPYIPHTAHRTLGDVIANQPRH